MLRLSRYLVASDPIVCPDIPGPQNVVFSTRSGRTLLLTSSLWKRLSDGDFRNCSPELTATLQENLFLVDEETDELKQVLDASRTAIANNRTLYECLQPTGFCNLACGYCGQDHSPVRMGVEQQRLICKHVTKRLGCNRYDHLRVGWFGGEPLAALPVIRSLSKELRRIAEDNGCAYSAHVVTNGLALVPAVARELVACSVTEVEITLDGLASTHDERRPTAHGQPTFQRIFANAANLVQLDLPIEIVIRCNVDRRNADSIPDFIRRIAALSPKDRLRLYFAPLHDWGNDASRQSLSATAYADREVEWMALMMQEGLAPALMPAAKPIVCMAVNPHAELIDPKGQRFNCTEVSLVPKYGQPNVYAKGGLEREVRSEKADALSGFLDSVSRQRFDCSACPMLPVCGGACPKQWEDGKTPCPSAKRNLKDRLLLAYAKTRLDASEYVGAV